MNSPYDIAPDKVIEHVQIWRSCRSNDRTIPTNPSVWKTDIQNFAYCARIMCGAPSCWKICVSRSRRGISSKRCGNWFFIKWAYVHPLRCARKKVWPDLKIVHRNVRMQQKKFLNLQEYLSLCSQILLYTISKLSSFSTDMTVPKLKYVRRL